MIKGLYDHKHIDVSRDLLIDIIYLFRQFKGKQERRLPDKDIIYDWMDRHPSGLDKEVIALREKNKDRIIRKYIRLMDHGKKKDPRFKFTPGISFEEKYEKMQDWWNDRLFQLRFTVRTPELLNEMLNHSLRKKTMDILHEAKKAGIPTFVNPYYLSLLNVDEPESLRGSDQAIRDYVIYSRELVEEFGEIAAWEKEDIVEAGKPNAAGWVLPAGDNIHRRYPEVAILIPDTMGRACGGLCAVCQRMYDFQRGNLNFNLQKLKPSEKWPDTLERVMSYFEEDAQLRDILITGGDALMSSDKTLKSILDAVYNMALRKKQANEGRKEGEKLAEILRVRLGTRLPVYLPQRIHKGLIDILREFKDKASAIGLRQFVIQTHFESAMEVTPEAEKGIKKLLKAGWIITNQQVFTAAASKRGHTAKLRKVLNDIGVLPYYTFSVKGYHENSYNFATNERAVQEQIEEKRLGLVPHSQLDHIRALPDHAPDMIKNVNQIRKDAGIPFLATDRNVLNLPGVGKSLTYRVIGITKDGRRILEFDHDHTRSHSPIIEKMGRLVIIESKSIASYLRQMHAYGENVEEYEDVFGYSIGETEPRMPIYEYPDYAFQVTESYSNLVV
jgi:lysine 2,3-aminomutase